MSHHDPFGPSDGGPTVIRPMPGGRRPGAPPSPPAAPPTRPAPASAPAAEGAAALPAGVSDNPLVACATDLLAAAAELRGSARHADPPGLREDLTAQVRLFEQCARAKGLADREVLTARYVLCALIDEAVLDTPWGSQSVWATRGLLITFHKETWGGEKFYDALDRLLAYPGGNLHLLELMYLCLALGFEGRYGVAQAGADRRAQLERRREELYQTIRRERGEPEAELSPRWRGFAPQRDPLIHQVPLWVFGGLAGLLLLGLFAAYTFALSRDSDPVFLSLRGLDLPGLPERPVAPVQRFEIRPVAAETPVEPPAPRPDLRTLLAEDIAANRVEVLQRPEGETAIVRGDGLFASARATLKPDFVPVVRRIGEALAQLPGQVLVTGHSDSVPIRTLKFPDNYALSKARAESVAALLVEVTGEPGRFGAEGLADSEPRVPENPRDARNRRVEIVVKPVYTGATR